MDRKSHDRWLTDGGGNGQSNWRSDLTKTAVRENGTERIDKTRSLSAFWNYTRRLRGLRFSRQ